MPFLVLLVAAAAAALALTSRGRGLVDTATNLAADALGDDVYLSPNFSLRELTTTSQRDAADEDRDGNTSERAPNTPTPAHLERLRWLANEVLEPIRALVGDRPIRVSSAYRSAAVNTAVGGSATSDHPEAYAADIYVDGLTHEETATILYQYGGAIPLDQVIIERHTGHLHIGAGPRRRREWKQTSDGATYTAWTPAVA